MEISHFTIYRWSGNKRIAIIDNSTNVHALLTEPETARFLNLFASLYDLRDQGFQDFFDQKTDELCGAFLERTA